LVKGVAWVRWEKQCTPTILFKSQRGKKGEYRCTWRDQTGCTQMQIVILVPRLNNLGTRPQERSSPTDRAQCMQMSSIDMGLGYDTMVMLTCKLLFATAKAIVDVDPDMPRQS